MKRSRALSGMAVALEPRTGEVLAMASFPPFNPNAPKRGAELRNRVVTDSFEPGSTVKTFTIAGALARGAVRPLDPIDCGNGRYAIGAHVIHDHDGLGWAGASKILAVSSNIGAAKIGERLGRAGLHESLGAFGLGERTGVGLPGEIRGQLPPPRSNVALATQSFGHGLTANALQMTAAYAAIANGGKLMRPIVVRRVVDPATGEVLEAATPAVVREAVPPDVAETMTRFLVGVVEDPKGTGKRARLDGWRVAGKTGTARKVDPVSGGYASDRHFSSFIGFAPAEAPRVVVGVFLDEPKGDVHGGEVAAPAFREIVEEAMRLMGVPATGPVAERAPVAAATPPEDEPEGPPPVELAARAAAVEGGLNVAVPSLSGLPARSAIRTLEGLESGGGARRFGRGSSSNGLPLARWWSAERGSGCASRPPGEAALARPAATTSEMGPGPHCCKMCRAAPSRVSRRTRRCVTGRAHRGRGSGGRLAFRCGEMKLSAVIQGTGARGEVGGGSGHRARHGRLARGRPGRPSSSRSPARCTMGTPSPEKPRPAGRVAVVAERPVACAPAALLLAPSSRRAMAIAAANFHGRPADALRVAGVTGTNGKTTVTYLVEACARAADLPVGVLGTVTQRFPGVERAASHTTPESTDVQAVLAEMREAGARAVVLEVSSHALAQERVAGMRFSAAGFTNLTRDHLDYHGDMEAYFAAKRRLFTEHLAPDGVAVVNARDPYGARLADQLGPGRRVWRYGTRGEDALRADDVTMGLAGIARHASRRRPAPVAIRSPLVGAHNLENLLCAAGLALGLGLPPDAVARGLSASRGRARGGSSASTAAASRSSSTTPTPTTRSPARSRRSARSARAGSSASSAAAAIAIAASARSWARWPRAAPTSSW